MKKFIVKNRDWLVQLAFVPVLIFIAWIGYELFHAPGANMEEKLIFLLKEYGYIILFFWSILEGEAGLVMAGVLSHTGDMNLWLSILVAALGGFVGDQIYFYIGRYNREYIHKLLKTQRRKFALAHLWLKKYGWPIIFVQRFMYGMRTIIPMAIGLTRFSAKKFAIINFFSALVWAAATIIPSYIFGEEILNILHWVKSHWYYAVPLAALILGSVYYTMEKITSKKFKKEYK